MGQLRAYLYFQPAERSLDQIEHDLGLSKPAVRVAARQLGSLGLVKRVWIAGDKRSYYRSADNIATAIGQGLLSMVRRRVKDTEQILGAISQNLLAANGDQFSDDDLEFLRQRVGRAQVLNARLRKLAYSPIAELLADKE